MAHKLNLIPKGQVCFYDDEFVKLSNHEYSIVDFLVKNKNAIMTPDEITSNTFPATRGHLNTTISRIRQKLPGIEIVTKNGVGYGYIN